MSTQLKVLISLLVLCLIPVSAQKLKLSGRVTKPSNGIFYLDCFIQEEGTYQVQRSSSVTAQFWSAITNFYSLPGTFTAQDPMSGPGRFYRLVRLTNAPAITLQPAGTTNYTGSEIRLTSTASGSAPLRLRWFKDGVPLDAATSTNLTFTAHPGLSGAYTLVATNPWGKATSEVAQVKVLMAAAPTVSGASVRFTIESAQGEFVGTGSYLTVFNAAGYYNTTGSSPLLNDTGYWVYNLLNDSTARLQLPGSIAYPDGTMTMFYNNPKSGTYNLAVPGRAGFQAGRFEFLE